MPRILIFSLSYHPFVGGAEIAVKEITDRLAESGYTFDLVTMRINRALPKKERVGAVTVHRIGFAREGARLEDTYTLRFAIAKAFFIPRAAFKALVLHAKEPYDFLWSVMTNMGFPAVFFRFFKNVPFVLTLQDGDTFEHIATRKRIRLVAPLFRKIFRDALRVQAISTYLSEFAGAQGVPETRRVVVPNGVDIARFERAFGDREVALVRDRHKLKSSERYVITTSRLVRKNAVDVLIRALAFLPEHVSLLIVGEGPERAALERVAEEEGARERVHFLGVVSHGEVPLYLAIGDVFARPSRSEGMGVSFVEAMAAGLPVVATEVGGIVDFLKDGETGLACEVDSPESLAHAVSRLLSDEALRVRLVEGARALVRERYDWDDIVRRMDAEVFKPT